MLDILPSSFSSNQWERDKGYEKIINHGSRSLPLCVGLEKATDWSSIGPFWPALSLFGREKRAFKKTKRCWRPPIINHVDNSRHFWVYHKKTQHCPHSAAAIFLFSFLILLGGCSNPPPPLTSTSWDERLLMIFHFVCGPEGNSRKHCVETTRAFFDEA